MTSDVYTGHQEIRTQSIITITTGFGPIILHNPQLPPTKGETTPIDASPVVSSSFWIELKKLNHVPTCDLKRSSL